MRADQRGVSGRCRAVRAVAAVACGLAGIGPVLPAGASLRVHYSWTGGLRVVNYRGYRFEVPADWPVIESGAGGCVRFDVHAVYLGVPSSNQSCPSWLIGTTESMLIEPGPARTARLSTENPVARQVLVRAPGIAIM